MDCSTDILAKTREESVTDDLGSGKYGPGWTGRTGEDVTVNNVSSKSMSEKL